ncbi:helicase mov-10 [Labeo rohita]|uniref:Helicase mov-10 n=1 Tax=Labeo rohita TaxID=84645 RepID=A0A498MBY8_LABRO|nr:helicase mov-10 [Labeo rohita]
MSATSAQEVSVPDPEGGVRGRRRLAKDILQRLNSTDRSFFIAYKHGVRVSSELYTEFGKIHMCVDQAEVYELKLFVENTGQDAVYFTYYAALHWLHCFTLEDSRKVTCNNPLRLEPLEYRTKLAALLGPTEPFKPLRLNVLEPEICKLDEGIPPEGFLEHIHVDKMKFRVEFTVNHLPLRLQHRAVHMAVQHKLRDVLFPVASRDVTPSSPPALRLFNQQLERNPEQYSAVCHIVAGTSKPAPYLVFGPPGTGKTVTIVEAIKQNISNLEGEMIVFPCKEDLMSYKILVSTLVTAGRFIDFCFDQGGYTGLPFTSVEGIDEVEKRLLALNIQEKKSGAKKD